MDSKNIQPSICILLFFIVLFFIYHIYYKYKPVYEGFSRNGFKEGFESNMNELKKTNLSSEEINKRGNHNLPFYKYKEDIPKDEIIKESNMLPNNSSKVQLEKGDTNIISNIDKKLANSEFILNNGKNIWTKFYCSIYDSLMFDKTKNFYEIKEIIRSTKAKKNSSSFLDIGSGTGHHVHLLNKSGFKAVGIDSSYEMVTKATENYPDLKFFNSDVLNTVQFNNGIFSHALMLYMTLYYIQNKTAAFQNIYKWLKPKGFLIIHLVNRDKFDPRIEASDPLYKVNPQLFTKERITKSYVKFNDFQYKGEFIENGVESRYVETMKEDVGNKAIRNEHTYYMESQKDIINKAKNVGFKLIGKINMSPCQYPFEYLYVLQK